MSIEVLPLNIKQSGSMWKTEEMPPPLAFRHGGCEGCPGLKQLNPEMEELMEWRAGVGQADVQSKKRHHSPFSSAFSTTGEFPNIPQAIFRCFFLLKQKVDFLLWGGWDVNLECFHWARLLLGRCRELWTCAISNQNWRFNDRLGIAGYKVVQQTTARSSANPNAADRWENDSENDAAACSSCLKRPRPVYAHPCSQIPTARILKKPLLCNLLIFSLCMCFCQCR